MTMDLLCALLLFAGNVGHLGVLSYKVLKFSELEVGAYPFTLLNAHHLAPCAHRRVCSALLCRTEQMHCATSHCCRLAALGF